MFLADRKMLTKGTLTKGIKIYIIKIMVAKFIGQQILKYGKKRVSKYWKRPTPASRAVGAGSPGPVPKSKQSKIQSTLGGTEYILPEGKNIKGIKFVNDKTPTQRFQDNVKDLIGIDSVSNKMQQRKMFRKNVKKKLAGGLLLAGVKQAAKRYIKSGGKKTTTIMKQFGSSRTEAKTDVLSGMKMHTSDQYTKNLFDKSMQKLIDAYRKK
jgi:hypothetical protein